MNEYMKKQNKKNMYSYRSISGIFLFLFFLTQYIIPPTTTIIGIAIIAIISHGPEQFPAQYPLLFTQEQLVGCIQQAEIFTIAQN